jgi:alcohol dehydrogenase class IV
VKDGRDLDARLQMLVASSMGATAFQRGLGAMHALAHPLGALYDAHHGMLNAILMPYVLKANESAIAERIELLARYLELAQPSFASFLDWVLAMRDSLGIPHTLSEIGIDARDAPKVGEMAVVDGSAGTNPIPFSDADYSRIFVTAVEGML